MAFLENHQYWDDFQPVSNVNYSKRKRTTQRMKLKKYTIIEKDKSITRLPSYYKFDRSTTQILEMLIEQQHSGEFHNVVGKGSHSVIIHTHCYGNYHTYFPHGNALKVYRLSNSLDKNNAIYKRVEKEYKTLNTLQCQHFSNNTPHPVYKNKNVILTSFIGTDQESAPSITTLQSEKLIDIYNDILKEIDTWYNKLELIHGSLTSSKILWMNKLYYIGWSHSVKRDHPMALKKLMKDCHFVSTFFNSRGVVVKHTEELFKEIAGLNKISSKVLEVVHKDLWKDAPNPNQTSTQDFKPSMNRFK